MFENAEVIELPQYQEVRYESLSEKAPYLAVLNQLILFVVVTLIIVGGYLINLPLIKNYMFWVLVADGMFLIFLVWFSFYSHRFKGYAIREQDILYKTGVFWRKKVILPYNRVQHLETHHSLAERKLKLATLRLFTAGGHRSDLVIHGLDEQKTDEIKQFLLSKINVQELLSEDR